MPKLFAVVAHPFYLQLLSQILDNAKPGPGQVARRRFDELWDSVREAVNPGGGEMYDWINPTLSPAKAAELRQAKKPDGSPMIDPHSQYDPEKRVTLHLSVGALDGAKGHVSEMMDASSYSQVRLLRPLETALLDAEEERVEPSKGS